MKQSMVLGFLTLIAFQTASADPISIQSITLGNEETKNFTLRCSTNDTTSQLTVRHTGTLRGVRTFQSILGVDQESARITSSQVANYTFCGTQVRLSHLPTGVINVTAGTANVTISDNAAPTAVHPNDDSHESATKP